MGTLALAAPLLQACGNGGTTSEEPGGESVVEGEAPEPEEKDLTIAVWTHADRPWMEEEAIKWGDENANVNLTVEQIPYGEMAKTQLTGIATGTLQDVVYSGVKWMAYSSYKGAFLPLDELVQANDPGMDDFIPAAIEGCSLDGKLYGLPIETNTGNTNIIFYNKTYLQEKGIEEPTDDWKVDEFVDKTVAATDIDNRIFGTNILPGTHYDLACWIRSWGTDIFGPNDEKFNLESDPKSVAAAKWLTELRTEYHVAPLRDETEGLDFYAGQMAFQGAGSYRVVATKEAVGDKFDWDIVLAPKGPEGRRGYELFVTGFNIYNETEYPDAAFALTSHLTSKEVALSSFVEQGQPPARISVFSSAEASEVHPIFPRIGEWLSNGVDEGPFPMPANLRFSELHDTYTNYAADLFYGDVEFEEGVHTLQVECQKVMDQQRG